MAGTLATLVSPYGIDAWLVVLNALRDYAAQPIIADWQPLLSAIALGWHTRPGTYRLLYLRIAHDGGVCDCLHPRTAWRTICRSSRSPR